jgi:hypothetical protein
MFTGLTIGLIAGVWPGVTGGIAAYALVYLFVTAANNITRAIVRAAANKG